MQPPSSDPRKAPSGLERLARPKQPEALPVRLDRRRIYILPSVFGIYLGMMLFAILLGSLNNGSNAALLFASASCAMLALGLIQTHQRVVDVRLLSVHPFPTHEGDPIVVRASLDHPSKKPREGLALSMGGQRVAFNLDPGIPGTVDLKLDALPRGVHPMGRLQLGTRRPLNIAHAWSWVWPQQSFLVYPRLEHNPPRPPGQGLENAQRKAARTGSEIHHLRDFQLGDALRDVAWKASARTGKLMAREYESPGGGLQHLAWEDVSHLPTEEALSRLAAWVVQADTEGQATELRLPEQTLGPAHGLSHRHACLTALARMPRDAVA